MRLIAILTTTFIFLLCSNIFGQSTRSAYFRIEIEESGLMFKTNGIWKITQDSLTFERYNLDGTNDNYSKMLPSQNRDSLYLYLKQINFSKIKKDNDNNSARTDMGDYNFNITFNKQSKVFSIYQVKIQTVFNLVGFINTMLPANCKIGYNEDYFR